LLADICNSIEDAADEKAANITKKLFLIDGIPYVMKGDIQRWFHTTFSWENDSLRYYDHNPNKYGKLLQIKALNQTASLPLQSQMDLLQPYPDRSTSISELSNLVDKIRTNELDPSVVMENFLRFVKDPNGLTSSMALLKWFAKSVLKEIFQVCYN
jgi:hypothetical protein